MQNDLCNYAPSYAEPCLLIAMEVGPGSIPFSARTAPDKMINGTALAIQTAVTDGLFVQR